MTKGEKKTLTMGINKFSKSLRNKQRLSVGEPHGAGKRHLNEEKMYYSELFQF